MKTALTLFAGAALSLSIGMTALSPQAAIAQSGRAAAADTLDELLQSIREGSQEQRALDREREQEFLAARERQQELVRQAEQELAAEEARSEELEETFQQNELRLADLEEQLRQREGNLGELFGVVKQMAGNTASELRNSVVSAQFPGRAETMDTLAQQKERPTITELEDLWYVMQQEMTESGRVVTFPARVGTSDGYEQMDVTRVGMFNVVANGNYLFYDGEIGDLALPDAQPSGRYTGFIPGLENAPAGEPVPFALDPSRGSLLSLLAQTPNFEEVIQQGGLVGYVIIGLGLIGVTLALVRFVMMLLVSAAVQKQKKSNTPDQGNPLGRIMAVWHENRKMDTETLELKLDEAILKEVPKLEWGNNFIKIIAVVAPLLGLLGTVTGMILTFQAITLFGTGDPKLMAGGISQALVTTVMGLCVAIPMVLLHSIVASRSRAVVEVLDEQSAGLVAMSAVENKGTGAGQAAG